jgi:hypothetical protein
MEKEEKIREKVSIPVRRHVAAQKEEHVEDKNQVRRWKVPRNWRVY